MSNRLTIDVEGIEDTALVVDIEQTIRASFHELALPGSWRVLVKPSHVSGRWDFRVYGLDVRHTLSITVPPSLLSSLIPRRLRESLERSGLSRGEHVGVRTRDRMRDMTMGRTMSAVLEAGAPGRTI